MNGIGQDNSVSNNGIGQVLQSMGMLPTLSPKVQIKSRAEVQQSTNIFFRVFVVIRYFKVLRPQAEHNHKDTIYMITKIWLK